MKKQSVKERWMEGTENNKEIVDVNIKNEANNIRITLTYMREEERKTEKRLRRR